MHQEHFNQPRPDILASEMSARNFSDHSSSIVQFVKCESTSDINQFIEIRDCLPEERKLFITEQSVEHYRQQNTRIYLADNKQGGYGVESDGELVSVFCLPGAHLGRAIVADAILRGAEHLYCFDVNDRLPSLYREFGFKEVERYEFIFELAPINWNPLTLGTPDIVKMRLNAGGPEHE